jgi:hypothetical protein
VVVGELRVEDCPVADSEVDSTSVPRLTLEEAAVHHRRLCGSVGDEQSASISVRPAANVVNLDEEEPTPVLCLEALTSSSGQ